MTGHDLDELHVEVDNVQLICAQIATALCADVPAAKLGPRHDHQVSLGPAMNALFARLCTLRVGSEELRLVGSSARCRMPEPRAHMSLTAAERGLLQVACERLLGLFVDDSLGLQEETADTAYESVRDLVQLLRDTRGPAPVLRLVSGRPA